MTLSIEVQYCERPFPDLELSGDAKAAFNQISSLYLHISIASRYQDCLHD